jgi:hypothetical protein
MSETIVGIVLTIFLAFIGLGWGALAMPNHPDRIKAAKLFFSLAALTFALTLIQWTLSTDTRLVIRALIDFTAVTVGAIGFIAGLQFAERSELTDLSTELSVPASALILEPLFVRSRKLVALIVVGALTFSVLINVIREAKWGWLNSEAIWNLPWRWILPSIVIGVMGVSLFLVVSSRRRKEKRRLAEKYKWLIELAAKQREEIDEWVKVKYCERGDLNRYVPFGESPNVILCIFVTNKSRLDVSLKDQLGGKIKFQKLELDEGKKVVNSVTDLPSGETRCLTIHQRLSPGDIQVITDAEYSNRPQFFNFDDLEVTIIGGQRSPDIDEKPLDVSTAFANAFPIDLLERGQRLRALSEIRGGAVQLSEHLRIETNNPVPKEVIEQWATTSQDNLKQVYKTKAAIRLWTELTHGWPIPESAPSQRQWLEQFFIVLGAILASEYGEYIRRNQDKE